MCLNMKKASALFPSVSLGIIRKEPGYFRIGFSYNEMISFLAHKHCGDKYKDSKNVVQRASCGQKEKTQKLGRLAMNKSTDINGYTLVQ